MPDFSKYSNYSEKESFSGVTYGANSPVLEVEQNEMQQIQDTKFKRLTDIIGSCVHPCLMAVFPLTAVLKFLRLQTVW